MVEAVLLEPVAPGRAAVRIGVDDQLRAAAERAVGGAVHVAEDDVGLHAGLDHGVRAAVDGDDQRLDVADVGVERREVLAVGRPADDDQDLAAVEADRGRGSGISPESRPLSSRTCSIVFIAKSAIAASIRERCSARRRSRSPTEGRAPSASVRPASRTSPPSSSTSRPGEHVEEGCAGRLDEDDPGAGEDQRPDVRVAVGRERRDVDDRHRPRGGEILGGDPVEVGMIDHRDLAGSIRLTRSLVRLPSRTGPTTTRRRCRAGRGRRAGRQRAEFGSGIHGPIMRQPRASRAIPARAGSAAASGASSSLACLPAASSSLVGAEHADDLGHQLVAADALDPRDGRRRRRPPRPGSGRASEATCGRWVMQITCRPSPSARSRSPTRRATLPPTPASISSKTSVSTAGRRRAR